MNTKTEVAAILGARRIALIVLSQDPKSYSRLIERESHKRGTQIAGVNPRAATINGLFCFAAVEDVIPQADAAMIILPPDKSDALVRECLAAGVTLICVRGIEGKRSVSETVAAECASRGASLIDGFCPLTLLHKPGFPHNLHGVIARWMKLAPM